MRCQAICYCGIRKRERYEEMVADTVFTEEHMEVYKFFQNSGYHVVEYLSEEEMKEGEKI